MSLIVKMNLIIIYFKSLQKYKKFCNRKLLKNAKVCVTDLLRTLTQWLSLTCGAMNYISIMNHTQESFATMTAEPLWSISGIIMHQIFPSIRKWTKTEHLWIFFFFNWKSWFSKGLWQLADIYAQTEGRDHAMWLVCQKK